MQIITKKDYLEAKEQDLEERKHRLKAAKKEVAKFSEAMSQVSDSSDLDEMEDYFNN